mgnify:CR=1 FL=1
MSEPTHHQTDETGRRFQAPPDAALFLLESIRIILDDGYSIKGLDPTKVVIIDDEGDSSLALSTVEDGGPVSPQERRGEESVDTPPGEQKGQPSHTALPGFTGNVSSCCGAPTIQTGNCPTCTLCGKSEGGCS